METWIAVRALTGFPEPLVPKVNVVAALTASLDVSLARNRAVNGFFIVDLLLKELYFK